MSKKPYEISKEWCLEAAKREGDSEIGAGSLMHPLRAPPMTDTMEVVEIVARGLDPDAWAKWTPDAMEAASLLHRIDTSVERASAILTAIEASGWKIVPVEPTEEMLDAGGSSIIRPSIYMGGTPPGAKRRARDVWADMLSVVPPCNGGQS